MIINGINNISNKSFSLNSVQGFRDSAQGNARGNNISGSIGGDGLTDKISSKPISEIDGQNIKLKEACTQFEQIFIKYMVDKMWSSTDAGSGKQSTEKSIWQDYFNNEISKVIAESNMTGISEKYEAMGRVFSTHSMRHAYATHCYENSMRLPTLQRFLGHEYILTTMVYLYTAQRYNVLEYGRTHPLEK
jgi:hypothetical protein